MTENIGNAILILGIIYLHLALKLDGAITFFLCLLPILTWAYYGFSDERKELIKAEIRLTNAKAQYYERKEMQKQ